MTKRNSTSAFFIGLVPESRKTSSPHSCGLRKQHSKECQRPRSRSSYLQGVGVDKDDVQAEKWLRKAAVQGFADGQINLGMLYIQGRGVAQDPTIAGEWFTKAADQDDSNGQLHLGMLHAQGFGGSPDLVEALKWFAIVSRKGDDHTQQARQFGSVVIDRMEPDEIAKAQRLAKEWRHARAK